ncbi:DNA adenine methylase [candidate division KSB1 bacterium]|nr:DNA adenine methylase [candidate division KSB1 bacterium]
MRFAKHAITATSGRRSARPFVKWAGGKQQLLNQLTTLMPVRFQRYLEPFVGGGAVFFHLWNLRRLPGAVFLTDSNAELMNAYQVVRDLVGELTQLLAQHQQQHGADYFYSIRNQDRQPMTLSPVERAARLIYLNRTCYNGLYRVNRQGQFNVPLGSYKNPTILFAAELQAASRALRKADLRVLDFRACVALAQPGDFFYFDPPYDPLSKSASFTSYTATNFRDADQRNLAEIFTQLTEKGCQCMLSNADTPFIRELYQRFRMETVSAKRFVNSNGAARGAINEVVVLNY